MNNVQVTKALTKSYRPWYEICWSVFGTPFNLVANPCESTLSIPFNQTGSNATANISTYNDVAGNQQNTYDNSTTNTTTKTVGNIATGNGGTGASGAAIGDGSHGGGAGGNPTITF